GRSWQDQASIAPGHHPCVDEVPVAKMLDCRRRDRPLHVGNDVAALAGRPSESPVTRDTIGPSGGSAVLDVKCGGDRAIRRSVPDRRDRQERAKLAQDTRGCSNASAETEEA